MDLCSCHCPFGNKCQQQPHHVSGSSAMEPEKSGHKDGTFMPDKPNKVGDATEIG